MATFNVADIPHGEGAHSAGSGPPGRRARPRARRRSGEVPVAAAVDEVDMHQAVALRDRSYLLRIRRVRARGRVEKVDPSARRVLVESAQPAEEGCDSDAAGVPNLPGGAFL